MIPDIDWSEVVANQVRLGIACVLSLPLAYDRERAATGAGLRTFPHVAAPACAPKPHG